jgi:hypothetical protein
MSVGAHIPAIAEVPPSACGCKKFALDALGDPVSTCRGQRCGDVELSAYLANAAGPCPWCWTYVLLTSVGEVALTLVLMANCITRLT